MGLLRSREYVKDVVVNGVLLGQPTIVKADGSPYAPGDSLDVLFFAWDDPRIPSGTLQFVDNEPVITEDGSAP